MVIKLGLVFFTLATMFLIGMICVDSRFFQEDKVGDITVDSNSGDAETLVVLLHAFSSSANSMDHIRDAVRVHYAGGGVDVLQPELPLGKLSLVTPAQIVAELMVGLDRVWQARADKGVPYRRLVFVGHSFGALLARKLYVLSRGETLEAPFEQEVKTALADREAEGTQKARDWANKVERIVLMAGINRGWSISHHMSISRAVMMQSGVGLGHLIEFLSGKLPVVLHIRRGAPFITQLRLQWISMEKNHSSEKPVGPAAVVVQLLGTIDDLVSPDDNIDLVTGSDFVYLEVPSSGHKNVILLDGSSEGRARAKEFGKALTVQRGANKYAVDVHSQLQVNNDVTDVVFVIHGIRDEGFWTEKIARRVQSRARHSSVKRRLVASETSSYGYFPMLSFLVPGARQEKVAWLMDRYTEAKARYPNASFHYVGHSNGTYLLAKALQDYESVSFKHVVFAGSVVKTDYQWKELIASGRVQAAMNFVATADWVVAFFPKSLQSLGIQDLGSAGHDGFIQAGVEDALHQPSGYVIGGHSAALQEGMWNYIADFVLEGSPSLLPTAMMDSQQAALVKWPAKLAALILPGILAVLLAGLFYLIKVDVREWVKTLAIVAYVYLVWVIVTRV